MEADNKNNSWPVRPAHIPACAVFKRGHRCGSCPCANGMKDGAWVWSTGCRCLERGGGDNKHHRCGAPECAPECCKPKIDVAQAVAEAEAEDELRKPHIPAAWYEWAAMCLSKAKEEGVGYGDPKMKDRDWDLLTNEKRKEIEGVRKAIASRKADRLLRKLRGEGLTLRKLARFALVQVPIGALAGVGLAAVAKMAGVW